MDAMEHVIDVALCPELAQALVMLYCRHLGRPEARRTLRVMAHDEAELTRQFDALDELHARHPFQDLGRDLLREELRLLYRHHVGSPHVVRQLRRLCRHEAALLDLFDREDAAAR